MQSIYPKEDMLSLSDLCKELSISVATGRNWIKLGKLIPASKDKKNLFFHQKYVANIKAEIETGENSALKSRRNKKYISGNHVYHSYVSEKSKNLSTVSTIISIIVNRQIVITSPILHALLAECAIQLILSKTGIATCTDCLKQYDSGAFTENVYLYLVKDLISQDAFTKTIPESYPELFQVQYTYEDREDILGFLYISLKNIGTRKATGSYYTPTKVVKKLCETLFSINETKDKTVFDPCCGTGNFLLQLSQTFDYNSIYGNDIDAVSVKIARINFALNYNISDKEIIYNHITMKDYLKFDAEPKFDFIIGNPPWGYEFSEEQKQLLRNKYISAIGTNIESYDIFVEQALSNLKINGQLSFVLPEAFLNVKAHTSIRSLLMKNSSFQYLEFLGNAFDKVQCPCIILQILYNQKPFDSRGLTVNDGIREYTISYPRNVNAECFSFLTTDAEYKIIDKMNQMTNKIFLFGNAIFALGIVTGNNKDYISQVKTQDNEIILKGSDICRFRFNHSDNYIVFRPDSFQQTAPVQYYRAKEKLLYRFICNQLIFAYDDKQTLSLNSCNLLIPTVHNLNIKYLMAVLNSRTAQFFFKKQFHSIKVLRSHIEQIPIPQIDEESQIPIITLVDAILDSSNKYDIRSIYETLDFEIAKLYHLTEVEHNIIIKSMEGENLFL